MEQFPIDNKGQREITLAKWFITTTAVTAVVYLGLVPGLCYMVLWIR